VGNAQPVLSYRRDLPNGDVIQVVVWLLSESLPGSSHPYKYRLHYQNANGSDYIRYDNERGKGDHRHIGGTEEQYCFESVKKLAQDFYAAIKQARTTGGIE
jgi:uncharacterized protein DUF6516